MEMYRRTYAEINLDNLRNNITLLQNSFPDSFLCPMLKANAYGHGDVQLAAYLESLGIQHLGVCLIEEGLLLRNFGVKAEILVFRGFDRKGAEKIIQYQMTPVVSTWEHIDHLETVATSAVNIHLKFDTGMNRLGFRPEEAQKLFERLWQNKKIRLKALVTHLLQGQDAVDPNGRSAQQLQAIHQVSEIFKPFGVMTHSLNTSGILSLLEIRKQNVTSHPLLLQNWGLRPGLMIYGLNPMGNSGTKDLKPVMTLKSTVATFRKLKIGETVSYSGTWTAKRESIIAVVPIGYADGYHRLLSGRSKVLFAGHKVPIVGSICMDYLMVDVTDVLNGQDVKKFQDQEVILFGSDKAGNYISPEEIANHAETVMWEILTSVGERVPRVYVGDGRNFILDEVGAKQ